MGNAGRPPQGAPAAARAALRQVDALAAAVDELQQALGRYQRALSGFAALVEQGSPVPDALAVLEGKGGGRPRDVPDAMERFQAARHAVRVAIVALALRQGMSGSRLAERLGVSRQLIAQLAAEADERR